MQVDMGASGFGGYAEGYSVYHGGRISSRCRERFAWHNDLCAGQTDSHRAEAEFTWRSHQDAERWVLTAVIMM